MKAKPANLKVYIILIVVAVFIGVYVIINNRITTIYSPDYLLDDYYVIPNRKSGVNEYNVATVTENSMINTYFNLYISMFFENPNKAYDKLNDDYRLKRFTSFENFYNYVTNITNNFSKIPQIDKYTKKVKDDKIIYTILDKNENKYIFSVSAVMVYEVYFDDVTVEIE